MRVMATGLVLKERQSLKARSPTVFGSNQRNENSQCRTRMVPHQSYYYCWSCILPYFYEFLSEAEIARCELVNKDCECDFLPRTPSPRAAKRQHCVDATPPKEENPLARRRRCRRRQKKLGNGFGAVGRPGFARWRWPRGW